jgi:hypothetical protein
VQRANAEQFQETDRKFQETDRKFQDTDRQLKELGKQIATRPSLCLAPEGAVTDRRAVYPAGMYRSVGRG